MFMHFRSDGNPRVGGHEPQWLDGVVLDGMALAVVKGKNPCTTKDHTELNLAMLDRLLQGGQSSNKPVGPVPHKRYQVVVVNDRPMMVFVWLLVLNLSRRRKETGD